MPSRRTVAAAVGTIGIAGTAGCLWRTGLFEDAVRIHVNNHDDDDHEVDLSIVADDGTERFHEAIQMPAGERYDRDGPTLTVGRYTVRGVLDGDLADEYRMTPLDTPITGTKLPDVIVEVDGELGRFAVLGLGGKP
ncbi:hypothetical protein [Halobaculum magnesiiphilum]|uniref:Uncharacterized protein n=1 Tax=Halobaculum magnesiiphilum TaxID=1017351 RepID=A0A8T8WBT4_9EURY|nr:hypothetical protein [Halobaculum magnesiiphilum]QZP37281.1 hypothetical protein K6T50_13485 [Halobaculum magnesiiphilum]